MVSTRSTPQTGQWCWPHIASALPPHICKASPRYFDQASASRTSAPRNGSRLWKLCVQFSAKFTSLWRGTKKCISAGASLFGAIWNSNSRPSKVRLLPVAMMRSVGRNSATEPAAIDLPPRTPGQERPELILRAPQHRRPCNDVFRNRMLHEQIGRDDRDVAARQRRVIEHAARAAPMVGMGVGEDDRGHGTLSAMLEIELHGGARAFNRGQRIDHDHAALALDQRHVGDIEAPDLIDAGHDLEESMVHVETRLPPQARIDRRRSFFFGKKAVWLEAPDHPALRRRDPRIFQRAEKTARRLLEIACVRERQRLQRRRVLRDHRCRSVLGYFAAA